MYSAAQLASRLRLENSADGTANSWVNTGVDRTIYMEVRVKKSDGVCHMDLTVRTPPKPRPFTFSC